MGLAALIFFARTSYKKLKRFSLLIFIFGILLTAAVFIPQISFKYAGATRWIVLGPINFQPSELLKFGYILYLAAWLSSKSKALPTFKYGFLPFLFITGLSAILLILQPDLGTLGVLVLSGLLLFLIAGGNKKHVLVLFLICIASFYILVRLEPYRMERILVFMNPEHDPQGSGYQLRQSLIAIGSGGLFGRGFGMSMQKFQYLPEPVGDSIFSVASEEFGFIGSLSIIIIFLAFAWRGLSIAAWSEDSFSRLSATGIVILILFQSFINIAALTGLIPLTGIPLSFVSQGGSALAITLAEVGILLNISKTRKI